MKLNIDKGNVDCAMDKEMKCMKYMKVTRVTIKCDMHKWLNNVTVEVECNAHSKVHFDEIMKVYESNIWNIWRWYVKVQGLNEECET